MVLRIVFQLLNAEVLDPEWSTALMFDFDNDQNYVEQALAVNHPMVLKKQFYDFGFETFNPILNLGGLYLIFSTTVTLMGIFAAGHLISKILKFKTSASTMKEGGKLE